MTFTDQEGYFVSEASIYRILKAPDLITSPAFIVIKAASEFTSKTTAINQVWQTDFIYLKLIGWGWFYLSTILDDDSRYIISWKLCTNMRTEDVTDMLDLALAASGCGQVHVTHKLRLLSDDGSSASLESWRMVAGRRNEALPRCAVSCPNLGQDRLVASNFEELHLTRKPIPAWRSPSPNRGLCRSLQLPMLPREPG